MSDDAPEETDAQLSQALVLAIQGHGASGVAPQALAQLAPSRSTLNRRLAELVRAGLVKQEGAGRSTRYVSTTPFTGVDIDAYFARPWQERPYAPFREALLDAEPGLSLDKADRCLRIQAAAPAIDRHFFARFIIDLSWASSVLEGSTYTDLDTQALIEYGQRNQDKPTEDAVLVLNHKRAAEHLWAHRDLSVDNVCAIHGFLTDEHGLPELADSDHFLAAHQRGRPREFEEVHLGRSAYSPPYRPGTGYVAQALAEILRTAQTLHPVQAALYLITRIPYLQAFANGNKRTARLAANAPLLQAGLIPLSFADMDKASYVRGMAAFYELGDLYTIEQTILRGYVSSVIRSSQIPVELRVRGFDTHSVTADLMAFINMGKAPTSAQASLFICA
jgi:Fic family protein